MSAQADWATPFWRGRVASGIYDKTTTFDVVTRGRACLREGGTTLSSSGGHNYRNSTFNGVTTSFSGGTQR